MWKDGRKDGFKQTAIPSSTLLNMDPLRMQFFEYMQNFAQRTSFLRHHSIEGTISRNGIRNRMLILWQLLRKGKWCDKMKRSEIKSSPCTLYTVDVKMVYTYWEEEKIDIITYSQLYHIVQLRKRRKKHVNTVKKRKKHYVQDEWNKCLKFMTLQQSNKLFPSPIHPLHNM